MEPLCSVIGALFKLEDSISGKYIIDLDQIIIVYYCIIVDTGKNQNSTMYDTVECEIVTPLIVKFTDILHVVVDLDL